LKAKAHTAGLFSLSQEIFGQRPENLALELGLDKDIVEAFEKKPNELSFILSLVELLEDTQDPEVLEKVARILKTSPDRVKSAIESAKKESDGNYPRAHLIGGIAVKPRENRLMAKKHIRTVINPKTSIQAVFVPFQPSICLA
jgi:hypothetical protein